MRDLIQRMQMVSLKILSLPIDCVGTMVSDPDIAKSAHDLKPEVARARMIMLLNLHELCSYLHYLIVFVK